MTLADLSIKRPIFITCIVTLMIAMGLLSIRRLGVDLFPNVTFPVVTVTTPYLGAGPSEIETLVSRPLEDEMSTLSGIKRLSSISQEGVSTVIAEFTLETDVKYAEQQIRDRVSSAKRKLPVDVKEPIIRRIDPADQPIVTLSVTGELPPAKLYDVANEVIRSKIEQIAQVGLVEVIGGRKREIHVKLDRDKLKRAELSASQVAGRLSASGQNIPVGNIEEGKAETVFRTLGEFGSLSDIKKTVVNFFGNDVPVSISDVGEVSDSLTDEHSRTYVNGKKSLVIYVFRQSGANTIAVVDAVKAKVAKLNADLALQPGKPMLEVVRDGAVPIRANVEDVQESIFIGIILAIIVVYFFLANGRSTLITSLALPNSLIGAFVLMAYAGFTINIMTLLALSLSVGLLIDDAIVVRENIFRHIEMGKSPEKAAKEGTLEVTLAVIATTLTVIAVFGPVAFLKGVVGQFFREFGLTICFAMAISLFDALTIAPMLSAYFAGSTHKKRESGIWYSTVGVLVRGFTRFQDWLEEFYGRVIAFAVRRPLIVLVASFLVFVGSFASIKYVPKTFLPSQDNGEFTVSIDLPPGTNLETMDATARKVDEVIRKNSEVDLTSLTVGSRDGSPNVADAYVHLVSAKLRKFNTSQVKEMVRGQLKVFEYANPKVKDFDPMGFGQRPFNVNIVGNDQAELERIAQLAFKKLATNPALKDVDINYRPGKPEFQIVPDLRKMESLGISSASLGMELRTQVEGVTAAKFRENGLEYDVRVRLKDDQRNVKSGFAKSYVPNINYTLIRLNDVAKGIDAVGPAKITRQDRSRYIQIGADIAPGAGMAEVMQNIRDMFKTEIPLPSGMTYAFVGQAESFGELAESMVTAVILGTLFVFLVLASLYESFITPLTIMLALPLAVCGSFVALAVTKESLNIFSMIGVIMLLGVATKNSILLVDYAMQLIRDQGLDRATALIQAGKTRLRPILMTTMALIAGTLPVALGLNEASRQRTSMGVAIIGGLISSTLLTLIVVPAAFSYIDRFRIWSGSVLSRLFQAKN